MMVGEVKTISTIGDILDRVLARATQHETPTFRGLVEAAGLDPARDFIGALLRDVDFRDEDLRGFNFSNADLAGADFRRARVEDVSFIGADLTDAIGLPVNLTAVARDHSRSPSDSDRQAFIDQDIVPLTYDWASKMPEGRECEDVLAQAKKEAELSGIMQRFDGYAANGIAHA